MTNVIPKSLQAEGLRFCIIPAREKGPKCPAWQWNNNYLYNDPELIEHIRRGGNVGLVGGHGGIFTVACDSQKLVDKMATLPTFLIKSGGKGLPHFVYLILTHELKTKHLKINGEDLGDFIGWGGQSVCPPSIHPSGNAYEAINELPIRAITEEELKTALGEYYPYNSGVEVVAKSTLNRPIGPSVERIMTSGVNQNFRNFNRWIIIKELYHNGMEADEIMKRVLEFNSRCKPPEQESVVRAHVRQMLRNPDRLKIILSDYDMTQIEEELQKTILATNQKEEQERRAKFQKITTSGAEGSFNLSINGCANYILENYPVVTPRDDKDSYYYDKKDGFYKHGLEELIKEEIKSVLDESDEHPDIFRTAHVKEIMMQIHAATYIDRDRLNKPINLIPMQNGIYNIETHEFSQFSPDFLFTFKLPIIYNQQATCENFTKWLEEKQPDKAMRDTLQEAFGYCLYRDNRFQKAFFIFGPRRSGKSTFLNVLKKFLGERDNVAALSLQQILDDKFTLAYLYEKIANIYADLSPAALKDTGKFLVITGGDSVTAEKKYGNPFSFTPITRLFFSANVIPMSYNRDLAFYRRWIVIEFSQQTTEKDIDEKKTQQLTSEEEMSGIFNWGIEGLKRLTINHKFSYPYDEHQVKDIYERNSDSIGSYINNYVEEDDENKIKKRDVYSDYVRYCNENRLDIKNQVTFGRIFKDITGCGIGRLGDIPAYAGVRLKHRPATITQKLVVIEKAREEIAQDDGMLDTNENLEF